MRFLFILLLLFLGCDKDPLTPENVYGCTDSEACNFNPDANIFDNSCEYYDGWEGECDCQGNTLNSCGMCGYDDDACPFLVNVMPFTNLAMMNFSNSLDLSQFTIDYWLEFLSFECEDTPTGYCYSNVDTTNIYRISNSSIFGVDCNLFYDDNHNSLTGYVTTTEAYNTSEGTGEGCSPIYLNNILSVDGEYLSLDLTNGTSSYDIYPVPNPLINNSYADYNIYIYNLPGSWEDIWIYDGSLNPVDIIFPDSFQFNFASFSLEYSNGNDINSGIYFYAVSSSEPLHFGSFLVLMPLEE